MIVLGEEFLVMTRAAVHRRERICKLGFIKI